MDTDTITLSRLNIVGELDEDTPQVVLAEIALCHNISPVVTRNITAFVNDVRKNPIGIVHDPIRREEWPLVARYINPNENWSTTDLDLAYEFLITWENRDQRYASPSNNFRFGLQNSLDLTRLNACVLYAICKAHNIPTCREQTMYQMASVCRMIQRNDENYARTVLYNTISHISLPGLMQLYLHASTLCVPIPEPIGDTLDEPSTFEALTEAIPVFDSKEALRLRVHPRSHPDAIVLAAINFGIDISAAQNPVREYSILHRDPDDYVPDDPHLRELMRGNPHLLCLDEFFNPALPPELYNDNLLAAMAITEGFTPEDIRQESAYTLLQMAAVTNTFYHGRHPGITNSETPFTLEEIDELDNDIIVCYGNKSDGNGMVAFSYSELAGMFGIRRNFLNPLDREQSIFLGIPKLKNLCKIERAGDTEEILREREQLYQAITISELFTDQSQQKARELFEIYTAADQDVKEDITQALIMLINLSMYMRRWDGAGPYPIARTEREPRSGSDEEIIVNHRVTQALIAFETACQELREIGQVIMDLPLLKYKARAFHPMTNQIRGLTIKDRIEIVRRGEDHPGTDSCIRISSNLFAWSGYRYMEILGLTPPFDAAALIKIS